MSYSQKRVPALSDDAIDQAAMKFRLLGDVSRLRILRALIEREQSVQQLCEVCGLPQPTVSRHLRVLRREGVVDCMRDGRLAYYRIIDPSLCELCEQVCGGSRPPVDLETPLGALGAGI